jgi:hypothetical protein
MGPLSPGRERGLMTRVPVTALVEEPAETFRLASASYSHLVRAPNSMSSNPLCGKNLVH